jgi:tryptophan-rich sensory protein
MLEEAFDGAKIKAQDFLNSHDRPLSHVAMGAGLFLGAALISTLVGAAAAPPTPNKAREHQAIEQPSVNKPLKGANLLWPALASMLTWSGLRIWNAPASPYRTRALGVWGLMQGVNALWIALAPKSRTGQVMTATSTLLLTAVYVDQARKVDARAAAMAAPYAGAGWTSLSGFLGGELSRRLRRPRGVTLH